MTSVPEHVYRGEDLRSIPRLLFHKLPVDRSFDLTSLLHQLRSRTGRGFLETTPLRRVLATPWASKEDTYQDMLYSLRSLSDTLRCCGDEQVERSS